MSDKIFIDGLSVKEGPENLSFIKAKFGVGKKFFEFFEQHKDERGWLNFDLKESKGGKLYCELNTWKKGNSKENKPKDTKYPEEEITEEDIPF